MNQKPILIAYTTRYGSTQEVAETITAELRKTGLEVVLQPMQEVERLDNFDAVVLGTAIYSTRWHPDVHQFLSRHQEALKQLPAAMFALGPLSPDYSAKLASRRQFDRELIHYPWLKPVAVEIFAGKIDPAKLGFFERLVTPASDHRDWEAIRTWANALPTQLKQAKMFLPA